MENIPICKELIEQCKHLDSLKAEEILKLRKLIFLLLQQHTTIDLTGKESNSAETAEYIQILIKMHQIFSLLDIDWSLAQSTQQHILSMLTSLTQHNGLQYLPKERTPAGRIFEHASDCKVLYQMIRDDKLISQGEAIVKQVGKEEVKAGVEVALSASVLFMVRMVTESKKSSLSGSGSKTESPDKKDEESKGELSQHNQATLQLKKSFITLNLKSNGKADLYFHAYVIHQYFEHLLSILPADQQNPSKQLNDNKEFLRLKYLAESLKKVEANISKFPYNVEKYVYHVNEFGSRKPSAKKMKHVEDIQKALFVAQLSDDRLALNWIEKILIQLLGYQDISVRDQAVQLLNMLYDGVDWQLNIPFKPVVRCVGQHFKINVIAELELEKTPDAQLFIGLSAPSPIEGQNEGVLSWHKIGPHNIVGKRKNEVEIMMNFGKFWKCGFYDWRIVIVMDNGRLQPLQLVGKPERGFLFYQKQQMDYQDDDDDLATQLAQGRFIVHAKGMKNQIMHEVYVDYQNAEIDQKNGKITKRGDFQTVEANIKTYKDKGITCLYLMGVLERDNYPYFNQNINEIEFRKLEASPLAITCRSTANKMLGGDQGFKKLMGEARGNKIKILVDCLARISSSRNHRKYRDLMLVSLDEEGRRKICYGTDGQSINYEDTAMLNYRKKESWDLLIDEIIEFVNNYGVDGIHLDNGQAWPQIMEIDQEELLRLDVDGQPAYSPADYMAGEVVLKNENHGYWNTNSMEHYANPFFIKMCKQLWKLFPNFMIVGECWGGYMFQNRQIIMSRSGIIPRLYKLPQTICSVFGRKLHKDGQVQTCQKENVLAFKKWHEENRRFLPEGAILIQSSSHHVWPYPAYLYGKGTWAATDILYFMPDIPITFMGEIEGEVYRVGTTQVFQHEQSKVQATGSALKKSNSQLMMALQGQDEEEEKQKSNPSPEKQSSPNQKRALPTVRSQSQLSALVQESKDIKVKEERFQKEIGPQFGFDLTKISTHYQHRRELRNTKMVLRYGELIPLVAQRQVDDTQIQNHSHVLAFARYTLQETAIISVNLNEEPVIFFIDMSPLLPLFEQTYSHNTVVIVTNWMDVEGNKDYYFLREFLQMRNINTLKPFNSQIIGLTVCGSEDPFVFKMALTRSVERTRYKLESGADISSEQISLLWADIVEQKPQDIASFANIIGSLQESFLNKLNMHFWDLFYFNKRVTGDEKLASRMLALCNRMAQESASTAPDIAPSKAALSIINGNKLGPLVFCCPELGRWTTVGGLGVMVDELAYGLALLGQQVWVITPYYERNRKGEQGYLSKDPAGFQYKNNINVTVSGRLFTLGIHEACVNGVNIVFLHNTEAFPSAYADGTAAEIVKTMSVFGKGCLQYLCTQQLIPGLIITNDWFTGFIAGYAKIGAFGDVFKGTTFFHIVHNLEQDYEGRQHPKPGEGALEFVHELPRDWMVDPMWANCIVNPSRCALITCDQWGTVSNSYKEDLLRTSSLGYLLKQKPKPFAFPNGIPKEARIKKLDEAAPSHAAAKRILQKKYFNYQDIDDTVPLFAFVGRITTQKVVHLILDATETLINKTAGKVNIIVGGAVNMKEQYSAQCAQKMWYLKNKFPNSFWAAPNDFFTDGSLVNRGADFGLMPSIFEPGGIVQHEFFVGGTPVIAFKTGGLKDSVFEFSWDSETGNGYTFLSHTVNDLVFAIERAIGTFKNKSKYTKLRDNAFHSTMDGEVVSKSWLKEFCRLRGKVFVDDKICKETLLVTPQWSPQNYKPITSFEELFGIKQETGFDLDDVDFGAAEDETPTQTSETTSASALQFKQTIGGALSATDATDPLAQSPTVPKPKKKQSTTLPDKLPHVFMMHNHGQRYNQVHLCGSFDDWKTRHAMNFDHFTSQWFITLHLKKDKYFYKYVINGSLWVINEKENKEKDLQGNVNNVLNL